MKNNYLDLTNEFYKENFLIGLETFRIPYKKSRLILTGLLIVGCLLTPFGTNFLIPIIIVRVLK